MIFKIYTLAVLVLLFSLSAKAQCNTTIMLTTQAEVDAFPATYGCTTAVDLQILRTSDITNLDSLYHLTSVGSLTIESNAQLANLSGLSGLTEVNSLFIQSNPILQNLNGLASLRSVNAILWISANVNLTSLQGIEELRSIHELDIRFNDQLTDLTALNGLTSIEGPLTLRSNGLTDLAGLGNITTIGGLTTIQENSLLRGLHGLAGVTSMNGLSLLDNPVLSDIDGLSALHTTGPIIISGNQALTNVNGFSSVTSIAATTLSNNPVLSSLQGLSGVTTISPGMNPITQTADLSLVNNPSLTSLAGLENIMSVPGQLIISGNDGLTSLAALRSITHTGQLFIVQNSNLENLDGLGNLTTVGASTCNCGEPGVIITGNAHLKNINSLSSLTTITDNLEISSNATLSNIDGLTALKTVGQMVSISNNASLPTLEGLHSLTSVGLQSLSGYRSLAVIGNSALTSLAGLRNLSGIPGGLIIQNNTSLTNLNGLQSITQVAGFGLQIDGNTVLVNTDGLHSIKTVSGGLSITNNPSLTNLNGLGSLMSLGSGPRGPSAFIISNNGLLANVDSLSSLTSMSAINSMTVKDNPTLTRGCGLYPLLSSFSFTNVTFSGNGPGVTQAGILANCGHRQPSGLVFSNVTDDAMRVSFTAAVPTPSGGYLVLMRAYGSPFPSDAPIDNVTYQVGDVIGSSTIVVGTGQRTSFPVIYLLPNTPYYFTIFSYTSSHQYETVSPLAGSETTRSRIAQPTNLAFSEVTDNSVTVSFTAPLPAPDGYMTIMRAFRSPYPDDVPQDGTTYRVGDVIGSSTIVVGMGSDTRLTIIYLEPGLDYYFDILSYRVSSGIYDYATTNPLSGNQRTVSLGAAQANDLKPSPYPNPFTERVTIPFIVKTENTIVQIDIFDQVGNPVARIKSDPFDVGRHEITWDGNTLNGNKVSQGLYMYSLKSNEPGNSIRGMLVAK